MEVTTENNLVTSRLSQVRKELNAAGETTRTNPILRMLGGLDEHTSANNSSVNWRALDYLHRQFMPKEKQEPTGTFTKPMMAGGASIPLADYIDEGLEEVQKRLEKAQPAVAAAMTHLQLSLFNGEKPTGTIGTAFKRVETRRFIDDVRSWEQKHGEGSLATGIAKVLGVDPDTLAVLTRLDATRALHDKRRARLIPTREEEQRQAVQLLRDHPGMKLDQAYHQVQEPYRPAVKAAQVVSDGLKTVGETIMALSKAGEGQALSARILKNIDRCETSLKMDRHEFAPQMASMLAAQYTVEAYRRHFQALADQELLKRHFDPAYARAQDNLKDENSKPVPSAYKIALVRLEPFKAAARELTLTMDAIEKVRTQYPETMRTPYEEPGKSAEQKQPVEKFEERTPKRRQPKRKLPEEQERRIVPLADMDVPSHVLAARPPHGGAVAPALQ